MEKSIEMCETIMNSFSDATYHLEEAGKLIGELLKRVDGEDQETIDYTHKLSIFMVNLSRYLHGFYSDLTDGEDAILSLVFPVGVDPHTLFGSNDDTE